MLKSLTKYIRRVAKPSSLPLTKAEVGNSSMLPEPIGDAYYGERAERYLESRKKKDYWSLEQETIGAFLERQDEGISVLDVPFGTGRFVPFYLKKSMAISGLDSSEDMLQAGSQELGSDYKKCNVCVGDALSLPFADKEFDLVVCFRFVSHVLSLADGMIATKELSRVCRDKVAIQLRVRSQDRTPIDSPSLLSPMHDQMNELQIVEWLKQCNLDVVETLPLEHRETYHRAVFICTSS